MARSGAADLAPSATGAAAPGGPDAARPAASGPAVPGPDGGPLDGLRRVDADVAGAVERELAAVLADRLRDAAAVAPEVAEALRVLERFVVGGGKRIRPTFAWWGWRGAGGDPAAAGAALRAVSALELLQACALVHDDLIDDSATRRGRPTVHVEFAGRHRDGGWSGPADRFGAAAAILLGDIALAWADDTLQSSGLDAAALARAGAPWRAMRTEVLCGQYLDVLAQATADTSTAAAMRVNRFKTAAYTVERPLHIGAALAGADDRLVAAYRGFGTDIGIAFQLRDDMLGVFGDPDVTGKPAGDDLREGKRTLLVALALERAAERGDTASAQVVTGALGDPALDAAGVDRVRDVLTCLGAVDAVEERIAALTASALDALARAEVAEPAAAALAGLAVAATRRQR
ncbi:polyprenyl synthetase family protein [Pseudonocardia benzenivorans]|jgi:geranylgeranyl diphosphate synthase type I|uniref:polyprenyl synthetase family protein n=1 Tax=Pseudonocardia TaxID=1847 RepID=UPI002B3B2767|nr:geranylgeranyl pyrophosphate synthase [Pseudonocardia sp. D17]